MCFLVTLTHEKSLLFTEIGVEGRMEEEEWVIIGLSLILQTLTPVPTVQGGKKTQKTNNPSLQKWQELLQSMKNTVFTKTSLKIVRIVEGI